MALEALPPKPGLGMTAELHLEDVQRAVDVELQEHRPQRVLPAEWAPQSAVQLTWPHADTDWRDLLAPGTHPPKTATNMVSNFQETVKIYQQGKKYYDALKSVNNLVKDARKVQQTILMVGDITDIYVNSFQRMLRDGNFRPEELSAIAFGYTKLLEESNEVLTELRNVVNITTLSMTDKERMDVVERCHSKMKRYRNLVSYYTNKNISVSYLRAKKKNDLDRIMGLYGNMNERYW